MAPTECRFANNNMQTTQNTAVYTNMGWLGDSWHRRQVRHAWTAVGLHPRYPSIITFRKRSKIGATRMSDFKTTMHQIWYLIGQKPAGGVCRALTHPIRADNGSHFVTSDQHAWPWPMTQSQTMAWVGHNYSRIMMSSRLLPSLLCNDEQSGILHMAYAVFITGCAIAQALC